MRCDALPCPPCAASAATQARSLCSCCAHLDLAHHHRTTMGAVQGCACTTDALFTSFNVEKFQPDLVLRPGSRTSSGLPLAPTHHWPATTLELQLCQCLPTGLPRPLQVADTKARICTRLDPVGQPHKLVSSVDHRLGPNLQRLFSLGRFLPQLDIAPLELSRIPAQPRGVCVPRTEIPFFVYAHKSVI